MKKIIKLIILSLVSIWPLFGFIDGLQLLLLDMDQTFPTNLYLMLYLSVPLFIISGIVAVFVDFKYNRICYYVSIIVLLCINFLSFYIVYQFSVTMSNF